MDWSTVTRVICNSGKCNQSGYMHAECFTKYEDALVNFMSKQGRGRTWNDKQVRLDDSKARVSHLIVSLFSGTEICGAPRATISSSRNVIVTVATVTSGEKFYSVLLPRII